MPTLPPHAVVMAHINLPQRDRPTNSWLYMPLILDAVGMPQATRPRAHSFPRTPTYTQHATHLAAIFTRHGITLQTIRNRYHLDAHAHIDAQDQEHLLSLDAVVGQNIALYGLQLVREATAAYRAVHAGRPAPAPATAAQPTLTPASSRHLPSLPPPAPLPPPPRPPPPPPPARQ
jgi:hypothetical protein